ncbi:three-Cys-motif partner protein [Thermanaeromonas toyohensis ToBE]|uniref:Three-Cys-motif partner protein n=1 Tax=Thermanaeromonas toyohensis ToBE TaxID=698762 RepID=A0A1W1VSV7_9FIRM|nr:three-Cys-motif partner protein TcmP [Thermanaeromonas toyohensis]SMB96429.1 three-Cys-motif partner protein [Thermanaeromonas toyohensis ToBE]
MDTLIWPLEEHSKAKHTVLREYLKAWFPILGQKFKRIVYIDGFAGPGLYSTGEEGSPLIALRIVSEHVLRHKFRAEIRMLFIESDTERATFLQKLCEERFPSSSLKSSGIHYSVIPSSFEEVMETVLSELEKQQQTLAPSFVFVDPFGLSGVPLQLIAKILRYPSCEVLFNFMYDAVNRWCETHENKTTLLFGTDEWKKVLSLTCPQERKQFLTNLYVSQLQKATGHRYVRSFEIKDKNNRTKYFLIFSTNRIEGLKEMKNAMWKVDETGYFRFSAFETSKHHAGQLSIFDPDDIHRNNLAFLLERKFRGQKLSIEQIEHFVICETPYLQRHVRPALTILAGSQPPKISVERPPGKNRGFPEGTFISFAD